MIGMPDLLIFTEASPQIGHGHVVRCAALADEARRRGLQVGFVIGDQYTAALVADMGGQIFSEAPAAPSYVIRDFRDGSEVEVVQEHQREGSRVLLLDDLTSARTVANVVCDSLMTADRAQQYPHSEAVTYLYGLEYVPLRSEFVEVRARKRSTRREVNPRLLVSFGGGDHRGITPRYVEALHDVGYRGPATIVADRVHHDEVAGTTAVWDDTVVVTELRQMADSIWDADLVATKLGLTVLECFCLGVGCVLVEPSGAHLDLAELLQANYPAWSAVELGLECEVDFPAAAAATLALLVDPVKLAELGETGGTLVDGRGTARIMDALVGSDA